jgi:hypothetical protein
LQGHAGSLRKIAGLDERVISSAPSPPTRKRIVG